MTAISLPTAQDWMAESPFVLSPDEDLFVAIDLLVKHELAAAPVVDEDGQLLGLLTEKDCLRVLSNLAYAEDLLVAGKVSEFKSAVRMICEPGMDIFRVAEMFLATNFPILPVVEEGKLCGLISRLAMLRGIQTYRLQMERERTQREVIAGHQADRPRTIENMQRTVANQTKEQLVRLFGRNS